jgi:anti-sigma factor ChrR (cupin superfamily)
MRAFIGWILVASAVPHGLAGQDSVAGANQWQESKLTPGVSVMTLLGSRTTPGPYVYRVKARNGVRIPPHWHTQTMHLTVLSGRFVMAMGESLDSIKAKSYDPGSFLVLPARMRHIEWFEGETVVQVETEGPLETVFLNPADDPRNRSQP